MSETLTVDHATDALAHAHTAVDDLLAADLDSSTDDEVLACYRELERLTRRLAAAEHGFLAQVEARSIPFGAGAASTAVFVRRFLRLHPGEAAARVSAAEAAGPQRTLTGEPLEPIYPRVAAAQACGAISPRQAAVIVKAVDTLPGEAQAEHGERVEQELVDYAAGFENGFDPLHLARLAQRFHDILDPDGQLRDADYRQRCRDLTVRPRPDGSATVSGDLTAECAERLLTVFDALGAPKPETNGVKDPRSAGQRRHDALLDALTRLTRSATLPTSAGVATTVIVTVDADTYWTGQGCATTSHGARVPASVAVAWGGADQRVAFLAVDTAGSILAQTSTARLFSENQRLALIARDQGCTFPDCDVPPAWTEAHHIIPWRSGGTTTLDNAAMVCRFHHDHFDQLGWRCVYQDGRPAWIPPPTIDPARKPRRNRLHETPLRRE